MADETKNRLVIVLLSVLVTGNFSWMAWLSVSSINNHEKIVLNTNNTGVIQRHQDRTIDLIERIETRLRILELKFAEHNHGNNHQ